MTRKSLQTLIHFEKKSMGSAMMLKPKKLAEKLYFYRKYSIDIAK